MQNRKNEHDYHQGACHNTSTKCCIWRTSSKEGKQWDCVEKCKTTRNQGCASEVNSPNA